MVAAQSIDDFTHRQSRDGADGLRFTKRKQGKREEEEDALGTEPIEMQLRSSAI